jgi:Kef-type K+ transport system membrane component KefB
MNGFLNELAQKFALPLSNPVLVFSLLLFIVLLSPILLRRIKIPSIVGLIVAGVIIGPYGLNFLEKSSAVDLISTIGLLYILFIAGLELDMHEFKATRNKSLLFGFFTFIIPLTLGFPVCYYLLDYDFYASLLIASMFSTHTLVSYPIVSRFGVSKNQAVAISVGGTILTDTAVLIIFAIIMGNNQNRLDYEFWLKLIVSLIVFSAIMFLVIPKMAKWFFYKFEDEKYLHYVFVLSVVFFAAFLAEMASLEHIIGAFVAGLALNKQIPHSSALMNRIEFIGNSLFIPFFLISVGMLVDIKVIFKGEMALLVAFTLTTVALTSKWLAAFFTQKSLNLTSVQRQLIFGLSSSHAAATIAIILIGYQAGILDANILNGTIVLILITCVVSTIVTEKAAKKITFFQENTSYLASKLNQMQSEHILLPIGNISNIEKLLEFALLVKDKKSSFPISILSVVPNTEDAELNILKSRDKIESFVNQAHATENQVNIITIIERNAAAGIARTAREIMADLVIIGWPQLAENQENSIGEKVESITLNTDKTTLVCLLNRPLISHKRIIIFSPPLSEQEVGFRLWLMKIIRLSKELSISIFHFGNRQTQDAARQQIKKNRTVTSIFYTEFEDWENFDLQSENINSNDILILAGARKNSISYSENLVRLTSQFEKYFPQNSKLIIYPQLQKQHYKKEIISWKPKTQKSYKTI